MSLTVFVMICWCYQWSVVFFGFFAASYFPFLIDSCLEFFSLGQTKRNSNSPFGQKGLSSVPKSFLRACICKIPEWGYGPHTLCCKQTSEFKHGSSLFQLQQSDLKYVPGPTSSHDLHPIESGLEKRTKCSYFKYKSRWTDSPWVNGKNFISIKYGHLPSQFLMNVDIGEKVHYHREV